MEVTFDCMECIIKSAGRNFDKYSKDEKLKAEFMKKVYYLIGSVDKTRSSPYITKYVNDMLKDYFSFVDEFEHEKEVFNKLGLSIEKEIIMKIEKDADSLLSGLKYAMVGNFIDFGALDDVNPEKFLELVEEAGHQELDMKEYSVFKKDLESANSLVYLLDNAGEIVFDKIFIEIIKKIYPNLNITCIVRGNPVLNDVTLKDAKEVNLDKLVTVIDNGSDIPGTQLDMINDVSEKAIEEADLIISKGQGNFETLCGSGLNIYYIFLCKCEAFVKKFKVPQFTGMFINEKSLKDMDFFK